MVVFDYDRKIWIEVLDFIKTLKGKTLDLGCGNGNVTSLLKNSIGLDLSFELLNKSRIKSSNLFIQGRCENTPFKDKSFDNVLLIAVLHSLKDENRAECLREINRILKKNGKLFLSVWCKYKPGVRYIKWGKVKRYYYFFKEKELKDLLTSSGFKILKFTKSKDNYFVKCVRD